MSDWVTWLNEITFARPHYLELAWLWMFLGIGMLLVVAMKVWLRPKHAQDSKQRVIGQDGIWLLSVGLAGLMIVALAGPKLDSFHTVQSKDNLDIIICVDQSVSMAVKDVRPSRHQVMVRDIVAFVGSPAIHDGDRLTLFAFSEKSKWRMPLSQDRQEFIDKLTEVEHPEDGVYYEISRFYTYFSGLLSHIPEALALQDEFFRNGPFRKELSWTAYPRVIFIFSDGDNTDDKLEDSLAALAKEDIRVYTVGIGTARGGSISLKVPNEADLNKLENVIIQSKLNMKSMDLIKNKTGGKSYVVSGSSSQVQSFLAAAVAENRKPSLALIPSEDAENFWWDLLAFPSLIIMALIAIRFARY